MDYTKSKIYALRSYQTDNIYIGSTCMPLSKRLYFHKRKSNKSTSKEITKFDDCYIELIKDCPCDNKEQLRKFEGEEIRKNKNICVNKNIAGRTQKEYQKYYDDIRNTSTQIICECGGHYPKRNKKLHEKTNIHINYLNNI